MADPENKPADSAIGDRSGIAATAKYNPHLWSPEELRAIFVVRQRELAIVLRVLRDTKSDVSAQHLLVTGQRGMGKSTLLQRIALAVEDDESLKKVWLPLRFPEEQYTVTTPAELWENVLGSLGDALERRERSVVEIDNEVERLRKLPSEARESGALKWIESWCKSHNKRLILLVDSTDLLFSNLAASESTLRGGHKDGGASALWRVRRALLHSPHLLWIGGSYQPLEADGLYSDAFLEFFQLIELRPLTLEEMQTAILAMARVFGAGRGSRGSEAEANIRRVLVERPERLRAMKLLTGGIPRTTAMLYELFAAGGRDSIKSDLERMLDAMTPLYKARFESLADQPRKILAHVMESWSPVSAKDLAGVASLPVSAVSTQLTRLERMGLVSKAVLSGSKRFGFQCSERFFNIWYLMRNAPRSARARVGWLVEFMRLWYSADELQSLARTRIGGHRKGLLCDASELEFSRAVARALPDSIQDRRDLEWSVFQQARKGSAYREIFEVDGSDKNYSTVDSYLTQFESLRAGLDKASLVPIERAKWGREVMQSSHLSISEKTNLANQSGAYGEAKIARLRAAIGRYRATNIELYGQECVERVEEAILTGRFAPDCPESNLLLPQLVECFDDDGAAFAFAIRCAIRVNGDAQLDQACKKAIELFPECALTHKVRGDFLTKVERIVEAESEYRRSIELNSTLAMAWECLAAVLAKSQRFEEAIVAVRRAIDIDPARPGYWGRLADLLGRNPERMEEAERCYRKSTELAPEWATPFAALGEFLSEDAARFDEAEEALRHALKLKPNWSRPLGVLGELLSRKSERLVEAETLLRKSVEVAPESANAWARFGDFLANKLDKPSEAEAAIRKAIELAPRTARHHSALGKLLASKFDRYQEAEVAMRSAIDLSPEWDGYWSNLGNLLSWKLNRVQEAEDAFRKAIDLDPKWPKYWCELGDLLQYKREQYEGAEFAYRKAIELNSESDSYWIRLATVLHRKIDAREETLDAIRKAIELNPGVSEHWVMLGETLAERSEGFDEAEAAFRKSVALDPASATAHGALGDFLGNKSAQVAEGEAELRRSIELDASEGRAWTSLGELLCSTTRSEEAEAVLRKAIELRPTDDQLWARLGELLGSKLHRYVDAEAAIRRAIELDPNWDGNWGILGEVCESLGRTDEAIEAYRKALEIDPNWVGYWYALGLLLQDGVGRYSEAEYAYTKGIALESTNTDIRVNLARLLAVQGRMEEATDQFRQTLALSTDSDHFMRLQCNCWLGNDDQAMQALNHMARLAAAGDRGAFRQLLIECVECHEMGISTKLTELMERSSSAEFLKPFALALRVELGQRDAMNDEAAEVRSMAEEVLSSIRANLPERKVP